MRELLRHAKCFGEAKPQISRASLSADGLVQHWTVTAPEGVETSYDVLLWDDVVARDSERLRFVSVALLVVGTLHALIRGKLFTFYRLNWKYGNVILYPFVLLLLLGAVSALVALVVHAHLGDWYAHSLGLPPWATIPLGILVGLGWIRTMEVLLYRAFFWQLLNDWVFNWQHGQGRRPDYETRLNVFADHLVARLSAFAEAGETLDEILIVGHSTGGLTAVEVTARLLARDLDVGTQGSVLSVATLGSGLPLVAIQPQAARVRADIASLVTSRRVAWIDYVAPQDWMNFPRFNPLNDLDLPIEAGSAIVNPTIRSARFREILSDETYRKVRLRPFRMHFQFLMSNDRPGAYDFFAMTLGSETLHQRGLADWASLSTAHGPSCETMAA
ncbi:alpha/beta hydrolase [Methylobacterium sp. C25]|uniref:alpha/beta hydrolase n=1 Tax=Methylobacterium sp. C25 TaxID=2721622 RepID=UPI001F2C3627|nr:alpha/beta hydrolase [Methylobacterium sp. C25]